MKLIRQKLFSMIDPSIVSRFLGVLGGFIFKAKVLHWAAKGKDIHEYLDAFWKLLYDFQDTIAEGWMGIGGKFSASDIGFVAAESDEPRKFIREVEEKVLDFYELLPDDPRFKGLSGEVEGFIQEIQKYKYLFSLCYDNPRSEEKEFSKKKSKSEKLEDAALIGGTAAAGIGIVKSRKYKKELKNFLEESGTAERAIDRINKTKDAKRKLKLSKVQTKLEDKLARIKEKTGEITEKQRDLILDTGINSRKDISKELNRLKETAEGKLIRKKRGVTAAALTAAGLLAASEGFGRYNRSKRKKEQE